MMRHKRVWILFIFLFVLIYIIVGAITPFAFPIQISKEYEEKNKDIDFNGDNVSVDRAMILESNLSAWEERLRLLNLAEDRIILSTFDMRDGESTKDISSILLHKANEGVKVQILVDGISGFIRMEGKDIFYALSSHPNIEIKLYNKLNLLKPWTTQGRMHDKYVVVDDKGYILGGRNTFDYFIGDYAARSKSYDREVLVYNTAKGTEESSLSSLSSIEDYFKKIWNQDNCTYFHNSTKLQEDKKVKEEIIFLENRYEELQDENKELFQPYSYEDTTVETNKITLVSNDTTIYQKEPQVFYSLVNLMKHAKKQVIIHSPYAVMDQYMYQEMKHVTSKVKDTRLIINSIENGDNFFASSDYMINKDKIIDTGMDIYEYDGGISYHGKSITIDDNISIIGSYNLDLRSTYMDTELMLVIDSEELTSQLKDNMNIIQDDCRKVIDEEKYEIPEHIEVAKVPWTKKIAFNMIGWVMQPFRYLV